MATPLPVVPAHPATASCCASSAGIDPALDAERIGAGLVHVERRHKWAYYSVSTDAAQELSAWLS